MNWLRAPRTWLVILLVVFAGAAALRLNGLHLFNPDSPRYLIMSRAIVDGYGYSPVDRPDGQMFMWRPPGVSALLLPTSWLFPYQAVPAKMVMVVFTLAMLFGVYALATRNISRWWGVGVVAIVACSPSTLLFGTEVLSEAPFATVSIMVLCLCARMPAFNKSAEDLAVSPDAADSQAHRGSLWAATSLLFFLPFLRSIGLALALAIAVWAAIDRRRWRWSVAVVAGVVGTAAWMILSPDSIGNTSYMGTIRRILAESGFAGLVSKIFAASEFYFDKIISGLLPGVVPGRPWFFTVMLEGTRIPAGPAMFYTFLGVVVLLLAVLGMCERRHRDGLVAFLYIVFYVGILTVWPFRDQRYVWPLIPIIWAYVPTGVIRVGRGLGMESRMRLSLSLVGMFAICALLGWQSVASGRMVLANQKYLNSGEEFYTENFPPLYYCDWESAGLWIRENSPKHARLLVRHCAVSCSARRFQRMLYFEKKTPQELHQAIAANTAKFLVVPASQMADAFQWRLLYNDPVYKLVPVYQARNVAVLEVQPNLSGGVEYEKSIPQIDLATMRRVALRFPDRVDLQLRLADMLYSRQQYADSLTVLTALLDRRIEHVRAFNTIGWIWLQKDRPDEAIKWFHRAAQHPDSKVIPKAIDAGFKRCRELMAEADGQAPPTEQTVEELVQRADALLRSFYFQAAKETLDRIQTRLVDADKPTKARFFHLKGRWWEHSVDLDSAPATVLHCYAEAEKYGHPSAKADLARYQIVRSSDSEDIAVTLELLLELADHYLGANQPGVALTVFNRVSHRFADSKEFQLQRVRLQLMFGMLDDAQTTADTLLVIAPDDSTVQQGRLLLKRLLSGPVF